MPRRTLAISPSRIASRERQAQALQLRKRGLTYQQIADSLDFGSRASAYKSVRNALDEVVKEDAYDLLALESHRLDYMLTRIWPQVEKGDLPAIDRALKILHLEAKLFGLYDLPAPQARAAFTPTEPLPEIDPVFREEFYELLRSRYGPAPDA